VTASARELTADDIEKTMTAALRSYGPTLHDMARHAAVSMDKILKGAKPADFPVEQPIPSSLLQRADQVIE
jgi:putative ABC transport system substrate-binding protein